MYVPYLCIVLYPHPAPGGWYDGGLYGPIVVVGKGHQLPPHQLLWSMHFLQPTMIII